MDHKEQFIPLFVPVKQAARIGGVSEDLMRECVNHRINPIPHIQRGKKALVRVASIGPYLDRLCVGDVSCQKK